MELQAPAPTPAPVHTTSPPAQTHMHGARRGGPSRHPLERVVEHVREGVVGLDEAAALVVHRHRHRLAHRHLAALRHLAHVQHVAGSHLQEGGGARRRRGEEEGWMESDAAMYWRVQVQAQR